MTTVVLTIRVLGILVGTLSVVSLAQRLFDVGLVAAFSDAIGFYRAISECFLGAPVRLLGLSPPQVLIDVWALSFIGAAAYARTPGIEKSRALGSLKLDPQSVPWKIVVLLAFGFSGVGIAVLMSAISPLTYVDSFHEEPKDLMKGAGKNLAWICVGVMLFFALNAYGPGQ
jgi:hypothetical protein